MLPTIFLIAYFAVLFGTLYKLFAKAGQPAWAGFVPFYNLYIWNKIIGKPWWWLLLLLVPGVNFLMLIIMNVNTSIVFGERDVKDHVVMTFLPWVRLSQLAYQEKYTYVGPIPPEKRKRGLLGQWGDAILFAVVVATVFRTLTFEAFTIPTGSMEKSLLIGDYLFVSKLSYGPRMPMTPLTFPFTHHTLPLTSSTPSFVTWFSQPYRRLPGFGTPQRGDAVVFNFPEGDTVVANQQNQSYYQLVRDHGWKNIHNPNYRHPYIQDGRGNQIPVGKILVRPVDKRENYIKRCVAIAGDSVEVRHGDLYVNGEMQQLPTMAQYGYEVMLRDNLNPKMLKEQFGISVNNDAQPGENGGVNIAMTAEIAEQLAQLPQVISVTKQDHPKGWSREFRNLPYFPNHPDYDWTEDNFGPLYIPKAGATVALDLRTLPLYARVIDVYENNDLEVKDGTILINGAPATSYTFKQDYYWLMGDNRHRSQDARFWGFVPHDHVVGKAVFIWLTADPEKGGFPGGIRWKRLFSLVR